MGGSAAVGTMEMVAQGVGARGWWLWRLGGRGGKDFGIVTENEAFPLPLNKAFRKLKSL